MSDTVGDLLKEVTDALRAAGIDNAQWEARYLLQDAIGLTPTDFVLGTGQRPAECDRVRDWVRRRVAGEPLSRIAGTRCFRGLDFHLSPGTLDPRDDSEVLVEACLSELPELDAARIADIGTGTGCLLLSILAERPKISGLGIDLSPDAAATARRNADALGLSDRAHFAVGSWTATLPDAGFDLILSNPPYIRRDVIPTLDVSVRDYDPVLALDGGDDGLDAYRALARDMRRVLKPGGWLAVEIGWEQGESVPTLLMRAGFAQMRLLRDAGDRDRVVMVRNPALSG